MWFNKLEFSIVAAVDSVRTMKINSHFAAASWNNNEKDLFDEL